MKAFSKEEVTVRRWWLISPHWVRPPFIPCQLPTNPSTTTTPAQCTKITLITSSQIQSDGLKWNTKHQMDLCLFPQVFFSQPFHDPCPFREIISEYKVIYYKQMETVSGRTHPGKHRKSAKLPCHHNIKLSFWSLPVCLFAFLPFCLLFNHLWSTVWRVLSLKSHSLFYKF